MSAQSTTSLKNRAFLTKSAYKDLNYMQQPRISDSGLIKINEISHEEFNKLAVQLKLKSDDPP